MRLRGVQTDHLQLDHGHIVNQVARQSAEFAQRKADVLQHGKGREQRPMLKQHAHPTGGTLAPQLRGGLAQHGHLAACGRLQPQDLAQQHGLAAARAAHNRHELALADGEVKVLVDHGVAPGRAKYRPEFVDLHHGRGHASGRHMPMSLKTTANRASTRITMVMEVTTEAVVPWPRLSVLGLTRRP